MTDALLIVIVVELALLVNRDIDWRNVRVRFSRLKRKLRGVKWLWNWVRRK